MAVSVYPGETVSIDSQRASAPSVRSKRGGSRLASKQPVRSTGNQGDCSGPASRDPHRIHPAVGDAQNIEYSEGC